MLISAAAYLASYLLGAIPFGVLFSRLFKGKDPRSAGSRNIGFTNVLRVSGALPAILTLMGDVSKGAIAAYLGLQAGGHLTGNLCAFLAVLGHCYPIYLKFKGGKAVATGFGVLAVLYLQAGLMAFGVWVLILLAFRYVALAALVAFGVLPFLMGWLYPEPISVTFSIGLAVLIFLRHRENISRMLAGEENRVGKRQRH